MVCNAWYPNGAGNCVFDPANWQDVNLDRKHFCAGCATEADAINFSVAVKFYTYIPYDPKKLSLEAHPQKGGPPLDFIS